MDLLATYPRRAALFVLLAAILVFALRGPIAYLNIWRANQEVMSNRLAWAASEYQRALFLTPNDAQLLVDVGYAHSKRGQRDLALLRYRQSAALDKQSTEALYLLALELQGSKDVSGAVEATEEAIRRDPNEDRTWRLLAMLYRRQGRTAEALATWKQIAARFPSIKAIAEDNARDLEGKP